jgi:hypothetical protein
MRQYFLLTSVPTCPVCQQASFTAASLGGFQLFACTSCQHGWIEPRPSDSELQTYYNGEYVAAWAPTSAGTTPRRARLLGQELADLIRTYAPGARRICEIGCGSGQWLYLL